MLHSSSWNAQLTTYAHNKMHISCCTSSTTTKNTFILFCNRRLQLQCSITTVDCDGAQKKNMLLCIRWHTCSIASGGTPDAPQYAKGVPLLHIAAFHRWYTCDTSCVLLHLRCSKIKEKLSRGTPQLGLWCELRVQQLVSCCMPPAAQVVFQVVHLILSSFSFAGLRPAEHSKWCMRWYT